MMFDIDASNEGSWIEPLKSACRRPTGSRLETLYEVCGRIGYHSLSYIEIEPTPPLTVNVTAFSAVENPGVS
jgi:hypothetical protein